MAFQQFAKMVLELGQTTKTNDKLALLKAYLTTAPDADKVWTIALFTGRRPRRMVSGSLMGSWCMDITGMPVWLFTECYGLVGDLSETIALLLPPSNLPASKQPPTATSTSLAEILEQFTRLQTATEAEKKSGHTWLLAAI